MIPRKSEKRSVSLAVLCDFDGTITLIDTFEYILRKYAIGDWRKLDEQYERGEISLQECMRSQGKLVKTPKTILLVDLEQAITFRPHFNELVEYCGENQVPLAVVSAGLDFVIKDLLKIKDWDNLVKLYAAKARSTRDGIKFVFPKLRDKASVDFKEDLVRFYRKKGRKVVYVGDSVPDIHALRLADFKFVVKDSRLARLSKERNIPAREISDFRQMVTAIPSS